MSGRGARGREGGSRQEQLESGIGECAGAGIGCFRCRSGGDGEEVSAERKRQGVGA